MKSEELGLDHFQIYSVPNIRVRRPLTVQGLFDRGPVDGELLFLEGFANPVVKNGERLHDKNAHFNVYYLYGSNKDRMWMVRPENQFGSQRMYLSGANRLLVPTHKREKGMAFPEKLDHYKVYPVVDTGPLEKDVTLKDQFWTRKATVGMPVAYAVPVVKEYRGKVYPIKRDDLHLTIFRLSPKRLKKKISVADQFGRYTLGPIFASMLLAVPGKCLGWEELSDVG